MRVKTQSDMESTETESPVLEMPLPESHQDLELLLEALHALNNALDQYEADLSTAGR